MGFIDEHYEKVAVSVGALSLVGLTALGLMSVPATNDLTVKHSGQAAKGSSESEKYLNRIQNGSELIASKATLDKKSISSSDAREVFLMKSIDLFGRKGEDKPIDLYADGAQEIHAGFKNTWWKDQGLEELMGYENAPDFDSDDDEFSNKEEKMANTDPTSNASYPDLLPRLEGDSVEVHQFELKFTTGSGKGIFLKVIDKVAGLYGEESRELQIGQKAYASDKEKLKRYKNRFTYKAYNKKRMGGMMQTVITLTDKDGSSIEIFRHEDPTKVEDRSVDLSLKALGKSGDVKNLKVGETFSLPFGQPKKEYKVQSISPPSSEGQKYKVKITGPNGRGKTLMVSPKKG